MESTDEFIVRMVARKKRAKSQGKDGDFEDGLSTITSVISGIEKKLSEAGLSEQNSTDLYSELADSYGVRGGIYRRYGISQSYDKEKFRLSFESYDKGYENELKPSKPKTYNRLNRLISRIFFEPRWLSADFSDAAGVKFMNVELHSCLSAIRGQLTGGRDDIWVLADIGTNTILLKEEDPNIAFALFADRGPSDDDYASLLSVLRPMAAFISDVQDHLKIAIKYLEESQAKRKTN